MKFETFFLIVTHKDSLRYKIHKTKQLDFSILESPTHKIYLAEIYPFGLGSFRSYKLLKPNIKENFWKNNVKKIILLNVQTSLEEITTTLLYELNAEIIPQILANSYNDEKGKEIEILFERLISETFPDIERISYLRYRDKNLIDNGINIEDEKTFLFSYPTIFQRYKHLKPDVFLLRQFSHFFNNINMYMIVRPIKEEGLKLKNGNEGVLTKYIIDFEKDRGLNLTDSKTNFDIYYSSDYIETLHLYFKGSPIRLFISFGISLYHNEIFVEKSLLEIPKLNLYTHFLYTSYLLCAKHGFYKPNYLKEVLAKTNIISVIGQDFLEDKYNLIIEKNKIRNLISKIKDFQNDSLVFDFQKRYNEHILEDIVTTDPLVNQSNFRYEMSEFFKYLKAMEETLVYLEQNEIVITEYLRDYLAIKSAKSNMAIQFILIFLTIVTIIITLIQLNIF